MKCFVSLADTLFRKLCIFKREKTGRGYLSGWRSDRTETADEEIPLVHTGELKLLGQHNFENVMAASAMAYYAGVSVENIRKSICAFTAVEHRIEYVMEKMVLHIIMIPREPILMQQ